MVDSILARQPAGRIRSYRETMLGGGSIATRVTRELPVPVWVNDADQYLIDCYLGIVTVARRLCEKPNNLCLTRRDSPSVHTATGFSLTRSTCSFTVHNRSRPPILFLQSGRLERQS